MVGQLRYSMPVDMFEENNNMYYRILNRMREAIRTRNYVMTLHAEEEMDDDNLSIFDVERIVLTGKIILRQEDKQTAERK